MASKPQRNWTTKERLYVVKNYQSMTSTELGKELNRPGKAVQSYLNSVLKLTRK